jgi:serine/threonine protein kinase
MGRKVAYCVIKVDLRDMERVTEALDYIRRIDHEYVAKIFDWEIKKEAGEVHVIAELFSSGNIREYVEKYDKIDPLVIQKWGRSLLIAMAYLHTLEMHSLVLSVKSNNVLADLGTVKLDVLSISSITWGKNDKDVLESN